MADIPDRLARLLSSGAATSVQIQQGLSVSQPTASRLLQAGAPEVVRVGQGRRARYALRREIPGIGPDWPLFAIDAAGTPVSLGRLTALHAGQYAFEARDAAAAQITDGLPWFLQDARPQGFIGRTAPQRHPELALPPRITDWTDDDVLTWLVRRGEDLVGDLLLGDESLSRFLRAGQQTSIASGDREQEYERLAQAAIVGEAPGSSAGGEQPKFTALVDEGGGEIVAVLVKFSPDGEDPVSERWADLLICESIALKLWAVWRGEPPNVELLRHGRRVFLQSRRFDRIGARGRRGVISLAALDDGFLGRREGWLRAAQDLVARRILETSAVQGIRDAAAFGRVIGNTDMHEGNLSFYSPAPTATGPHQLAPLYDMLPMAYAPTPAVPLPMRPMTVPVPTGELLEVWPTAIERGLEFWRTVAAHAQVSATFAAVARENIDVLASAP